MGADHDWVVQPMLWLGLIHAAEGRDEEASSWIGRAETAYRDLGLDRIRGGELGLTTSIELAAALKLDPLMGRLQALAEELAAPSSPGSASDGP